MERVIEPESTMYFQIDQRLHKEQGIITHRFWCEEQSTLELSLAITGGSLVTHHIELIMNGPGAKANFTGGYACKDDQRVGIWVVQKHLAKNTTSYSCIKGAVTDTARVEYHGMIQIHDAAVHADAALYNKNIVLNAQARVLSIPSLEVHAHEVQCKHGTAVGRFDNELLMYMLARGLTREKAEALLLEGFFTDELALLDEQRSRILKILS